MFPSNLKKNNLRYRTLVKGNYSMLVTINMVYKYHYHNKLYNFMTKTMRLCR